MIRKLPSIWWITSTLLLLIVSFFFFSETDYSENQIESRHEIGACYMSLGSDYFKALNNEIESMVEQKGDLLIKRDGQRDQHLQNEQMINLIDEGIEGLFVVPIDWKLILPALEYAKEKKVPVVVVDTDVYNTELVDITITSDNYNIGVQLANYLISQKQEAKILIVTQKDIKSCMDRVNGFVDTIARQEHMQVVDHIMGDGSSESVYLRIMDDTMDISAFDTVFSVNDAMAYGALAATKERQRTCQILSVNGSPTAKKMIQNGDIMVTAAQFPSEMGMRASEAMYTILEGQQKESTIKMPIKLITKYTVNSYNLDKWQ